MKRLLILILFINNISSSQSKIDLKFYNTCLDSIVELDYFIQSEDLFNSKNYYTCKDSIIDVKPGKYIIDVIIKENAVDYKIFTFTKNFFNEKVYNDTIELPKVLKKYRDTSQYAHIYFGFFLCDKICDGYIVDYCSNGEIRLEGNFENRIPNNEIGRYDNIGKLTGIEIYDKNGILKKTKYLD
jgi:hypothetical protein